MICRRARRACPGFTRVKVRLTAAARVTVHVQRVRKGQKPRVVRARTIGMGRKGSVRVKAKGLRAGHYRVLVRLGTGKSGHRLRVR